jgi:N-acyl-D-amino-acid deacylase
MRFDIIIRNGTIVDGTGRKAYRADLTVLDRKIHDIGLLEDVHAGKIIDARGLVVSPGFIDIHGHSDVSLIACPTADSKIMQGITTEVGGNCGDSPGPLCEESLEDCKLSSEKYGVTVDWRTLGEFLDKLEGKITVNYATLAGLGTIRGAVMGSVDRRPTDDEMSKMQKMVDESISQGAFGVSTGLVYAPGMYADTGEIVELAKRASRLSGIYTSHIRGEGRNLKAAVEEAISIGRSADMPAQISHLKATGKSNWGMMPEILSRIDEARKDGIDVTADRYPYTAGATSLAAVFPDWAHEGGRKALLDRLTSTEQKRRLKESFGELVTDVGWENIVLTNAWSTANKELEGKSIAEGSLERNTDPFDLLVKLVLDSEGLASMVSFTQDEDDMLTTLTHACVMVGSDSGVKSPVGKLSEGRPHPRCYGAFPKFFSLVVNKKKLLTMEEAVRKMTGMAAERLKLKARGSLKAGSWADIVLFDPSRIADEATYENPHTYPSGIEYVIVNGTIAVEKGVHTGATPGSVLRIEERAVA